MGFNHVNIPADGQHVIHRWEITSVNELDTIAITISELHKLALDTTTNVYYKLSNITPRSWTKINSSTTFNDDYIPSIEKGAINGIAPLDSTGKLSIDYLPSVVNKVESVNSQVGIVNLNSSDVGAIASTEKGAVSGVAPLDVNSKIIDLYLPTYVSGVNGQTGSVTLVPSDIGAIASNEKGVPDGVAPLDATGKVDSSYLPATSNSVTSVNTYTGAVVLTKSDVGLGNVDNTSDANKPVSTATQTALNGKANTSHTHTKSDVGLGNVDNTSDANKPISTATQTALNAKVTSVNTKTGVVTLVPSDIGAIPSTEKGSANGVAPLNASSKIDSTYLPAFSSDVTSVNGQTGAVTIPVPDANTTIQGNTFNGVNQLVKLDSNGKLPAIDGSQLTGISGSVTSVNTKTGVVTLTKSDIGLGSADNTSDANKPVSTATQTALDSKVTSVNSKTGVVTLVKSDIGLGNVDNTSDLNKPISTAVQTALDNKVSSVNGQTGTVVLTKSDLSLANVDNTSDLNKPISTATQTALDNYVLLAEKGSANGVVPLDATSKISSAYLPSYIDDVLEYANLAAFPATGESNKIYIAIDTNIAYRWGGSTYTIISAGAVQSVNGYTGIINLTKSDIGLANADNTSDLNKPISTATQTALNNYVLLTEKGSANGVVPLDATSKISSSYLPVIVSDVTSVNSYTGAVILTKSDFSLDNVDNTSDANKPVSTATQTALNNYVLLTEKGALSGVAPLDATGKVDSSYLPTFISDVNSVNGYTGTVVLTAANLGLGNVDNIPDIDKPISTATQTALDGKSDTSHTHNYAGSSAPGGSATSVAHTNIVTFDTGSNEGTDKYTFDGSADVAFDIKAGTNISLTKTANMITINSTSSGITNLSTSYSSTDVTIASDTGNDSTILSATITDAGVMSATDKSKLDSIAVANLGTVTSIGLTVPTGLTVSNSPITSSGTIAISTDIGYSIPTIANQTNWNTAYSNYLNWDGGSTSLVASTGRTSLGATTLGSNLFTLTNVSEVTYPRFNADNTISALNTNSFITAIGAIPSTEKGSASGVAPLNASSKIDSSYLPAFTSDVNSVNGQTGVVTIPVPDVNTTIQGNTFNGANQLVKLDATGKLPAIDGSQLTGIISSVTSVNGYTGTVILTKSDIGLGNVDNTSDLNKPISTAVQTALNSYIPSDEKGAINGVAPLDSSGKVSNTYLPVFTSDVNSVNGYTGVINLTKSDIGLGNVDNTSDANKPVSTATQTALDNKSDTSHTHNYAGSSTPGGSATSVAYYNVIKFDTGTLEDTDIYSFNGSSGKTIDFKAGTNISLTKVAGSVTINSTSSGSVTSVGLTVPTGLTVSNSPITSSGVLGIGLDTGYSIPTIANQANWNTAYSNYLNWDGGSTNLNAVTGRTSLGATTLGSNLFTLANPDAITYPRFNADNTISALTASAYVSALSVISSSEKGSANGVVPLDTNTKIDISYLPAIVSDVTSVNSKTGAVILIPSDIGAIASTEKGALSGVAPLDATGKVSSTYLPSYIDDVLEYANLASFPVTGESNKIYIAIDTNLTYRWGGSVYVLISSGAVQSVNGYTGVINLTKSDIGLGNVDNTSDLNKPISTAVQIALDGKSDISHTHNYVTSVNTKTGSVTLVPSDIGAIATSEKGVINGVAPLDATGKVDSSYLPATSNAVASVNSQTGTVILTKSDIGLSNVDNTSDLNKPVSTAVQTALNSKVDSVNGQTGVVTLTKSDIGLGNVDNTSDLNKPVSTAVQTALNSYILLTEKGAASGVAPLNASSKIDSIYLPTISSDVTSVNTYTGAVVLTKSDIGLANVDNTSDANKPVSTATQTALDNYILLTEKGALSGVVPLNATGKIDSSYLPTFTSDVTSVNGQTGAVTIATPDVNTTIQGNTFNGANQLVKLDAAGKLPAIDGSQLTGISGGGAVDSVNGYTGVVVLAKSDVGLGSVDNTSDANKPISTATQTALDGKASSSHTHGDILNDGTITSANVTAASGDYILISDSSNSSKIQKAIAIGVDTTTYLRNDGTWQTVSGGGGVTVSDDISTNATYYPTFSTITSGTLSTEKVSSTKLTYNPSTGALTATKFTSLSDAKLKTNITDIKGLDAVSKIRGVEFDWIDGSGHTAGVIAQELEEVLPFLVDKSMIDETKSVNYIGIIAYLIESVKELKTEIELIKKGL